MKRQLTTEELIAKAQAIRDDPKNKMPPGSFWLYTAAARKRLDKIAWEITYLLAEKRAANGDPVPTNGYSGRNSNRR
jgi:hypothetical protein